MMMHVCTIFKLLRFESKWSLGPTRLILLCYRLGSCLVSLVSNILGESHPDTIVSLHNLAECLHAMGRSEEAVAVQEKIVSLVEVMGGGEGAAATPEVAPPAEPVTMPTPDPNLNFKTNPQLFSSQSPKKTNPTASKSQYQPVSRKKR